MNKIQHANHVFSIIEEDKQKYMKFNYMLIKGGDIDYSSKEPGATVKANRNTVLSAHIKYVDRIEEATLLNNNPNSDKYDDTCDVHGIFEREILSMSDKIRVVPFEPWYSKK